MFAATWECEAEAAETSVDVRTTVPVLPFTETTFATLVRSVMFAATCECEAEAAETSTEVRETVPVFPLTLATFPAPAIVIDEPAVETVTFAPATIDGVPVIPLTLTTFATLVRSVTLAATWE
jgi:hypothetical protein